MRIMTSTPVPTGGQTEQQAHLDPQKRKTEERIVTDKPAFICPFKWRRKHGIQVYFIGPSGATYWYFTTQMTLL